MFEEIMIIIVRTIAIYFAIFLAFRVMGKREVGELSIMDLVVYILLAEIGILAIENRDQYFLLQMIPMVLIVVIQMLSARLSLRSNTMRDKLEGKASIIIRNGEIDEKEMAKQKYNMDDLLMQMREQKVFDLSDVQLAVLETNGKLSVFEKKENPPSVIDPIIVDGEFHQGTLKELNLTEEEVKNMLKEKGVNDYKQVSIAQMKSNGDIHIDLKNN